jgi:spoIIIJ-associated protein
MTQDNLEKIKEISKVFFSKMNLGIEVDVGSPQDSTINVNLKLDEPQVLIGERGQTLAEIQHLLRAVLRKQVPADGPFYINLDINDYKKKKAEYLKEMAKTTADEVALTKKEKNLPPMPAYERRIIHLALASRGDVVTESIGQEPERYIVVRSYP